MRWADGRQKHSMPDCCSKHFLLMPTGQPGAVTSRRSFINFSRLSTAVQSPVVFASPSSCSSVGLNVQPTTPRDIKPHQIIVLRIMTITLSYFLRFYALFALGHKRPFRPILAQCPLPRVKRPFGDPILEVLSRTSALLNSGHSDRSTYGELTGS